MHFSNDCLAFLMAFIQFYLHMFNCDCHSGLGQEKEGGGRDLQLQCFHVEGRGSCPGHSVFRWKGQDLQLPLVQCYRVNGRRGSFSFERSIFMWKEGGQEE